MYNAKVYQGALDAEWRAHLNREEKQRLAVLERRMALKIAAIEEMVAERQKIMRRATARRRRKAK